MQVKSGVWDLIARRNRKRQEREGRNRAAETTHSGRFSASSAGSTADLPGSTDRRPESPVLRPGRPLNEPERVPRKRYVSETGKTSRAFRAYVDLMDTADWLREMMSRHLGVGDAVQRRDAASARVEQKVQVQQTKCGVGAEAFGRRRLDTKGECDLAAHVGGKLGESQSEDREGGGRTAGG